MSAILGKPEVHPIFGGKKTFKQYNPPDFKFHPRELTDLNFTILCSDTFFFLSIYPATASLAFCIV